LLTGQSLDTVLYNLLTLIWVSTTYYKLSKDFRRVFDYAKSCRPNMCTVINDDAHFFHWLIVVCSGQVFKYSQKVFIYQHQYLGILNII